MLDTVEGKVIAEGKTKVLRRINESIVEVYSKDDLTAGNGARHDVLEGKGALANLTTCNVFELLCRSGLSVAYVQKTGQRTFEARKCKMIKLEVVVRREAAKGGSYLKRRPSAKEGDRFKIPEVEFYLKTSGRQWRGQDCVGYILPVDDPYLFELEKGKFRVYDPGKPLGDQEPLFSLPFADLGLTTENLAEIEAMARRTFSVLEKAWLYCSNGLLKDFKLEFGWYAVGKFERPVLMIADVVDNDSWRLEIGGREVSKEIYRQGADLAEVLCCYQLVAERTREFGELAA